MTDRPFLTTERLDLWLPRPGDLKAMHAIVTHPDTSPFLAPQSELHEHATRFTRGAGSWFLYGYGPFMVRLRGQAELIGNCGIFHSFRGLGEDFDDNPEAGWIVSCDHVGRGIASEAMQAVLEWFDREHGPQRVVCMIAPENEASLRLAGKLGFTATRGAQLPDGAAVRLFERPPNAARPETGGP